MIPIQLERFIAFVGEGVKTADFVTRLDRMFGRIQTNSKYTPLVVRNYVDATAAAVTQYLPDGTKNPDKDYFYQKSDASGNAVTISAFGTQLINGAATYALAAQYKYAQLAWNGIGWAIVANN